MSKSSQNVPNSEGWVTIRDSLESDSGFLFPKYEAICIKNTETEYVEGDIILIKKTNPINGREQKYHLPKKALEEVIDSF